VKRSLYFVFLALAGWALAGSAGAEPKIILGPSDNLAADQPRVAIELVDPLTDTSIGPVLYNTFLLDTAANGIIAAGAATSELNQNGYRLEGTYLELGVGGYQVYDVSAPYDLYFSGSDYVPEVLHGVRILSDPFAEFGSFAGILGMPAMVDRVTTLDLTAMVDAAGPFGIDYIGVDFSDQLPAADGHRYTVPLTLVEFSPGEGDVLPTYAPIPFTTAEVRNGRATRSGQFVVDTGAQMSIISSAVAIQLGLDSDGDGSLEDETDFFMPIGGVGGTVEAPVLPVGQISVSTVEGVDLVWTDLEVLVLDIDPSIDGIMGMDLLASGWGEALLEALMGGTDLQGYFRQVHFDFGGGIGLPGAMALDLRADLDQVLYPGDVNRDLRVSLGDLVVMAGNWSGTGKSWEQGDLNGDGLVWLGDLCILAGNWGWSLPGEPVPEPASAVLLLSGALGLVLGRTRRRRR